MGRWSRRLAARFIEFAGVSAGDRILDVGCGTGSLAFAIAAVSPNSQIVGIDPSPASVGFARKRAGETRLQFDVGDAQKLPYPDASFDKAVALLVMNFIPDPRKTLLEMIRVTRPGGRAAAAVWDYGDGMTMLRTFWDAAAGLDPAAEPRHEKHMPYCRKGELSSLWSKCGLLQVQESGLEITLDFPSFDDYFQPFLTGVGPSGSYAKSLPPDRKIALREKLREEILGKGPDRPISMKALAWVVRGTVPER